MASRGLTDLSPQGARHALLELPTNRAEYVGVLQDIGDYRAVPAYPEVWNIPPSDCNVRAQSAA